MNTPATDLEAWAENTVPARICSLPIEYKLRPGDVGLEGGVGTLLADLQAGGEVAEQAFLAMNRLKSLVLNLMRDQCKLDFSNAPVSQWPHEDLLPAPWGNDFETSDNPKNKQGNRNTNSPRPGWFFRMVEANAEIVVRQLRFWSPEGVVDAGRVALMERGEQRRRALLLWDKIKSTSSEPLVTPIRKTGKRKEAATLV